MARGCREGANKVASLAEGDMQVRWTAGWRAMASGTLDGWCWNPAAPDARLTVEVLVDGVATGIAVADQPRRDLERRGIGDGAHGFSIRIDPALATGPERLVAVRIVGDGRIVGQQLVGRPEPPPDDPAADALAEQLRGLSADIEVLVATRAARPPPLSDHLATLAAVLRTAGARGDPAARALAATRAVLLRELGPARPVAARPTVSLALFQPRFDDAVAMLRVLEPHHELLLENDAAEPRWALLASLAPATRIVAREHWPTAARGAVFAMLDRPPASLVALDAALARLAGEPDTVLIGAGLSADNAEAWSVPAATGLRVAAAPALLAALGDVDDGFCARVRRRGARCVVLAAPWAMPA